MLINNCDMNMLTYLNNKIKPFYKISKILITIFLTYFKFLEI